MFAAIASLITLTLSGVGHAADTSLYNWSTYERDLLESYVQPEPVRARRQPLD